MFKHNIAKYGGVFAASECTYFISNQNLYYTGKPSFIKMKRRLVPQFICNLMGQAENIKDVSVADNGFLAMS